MFFRNASSPTHIPSGVLANKSTGGADNAKVQVNTTAECAHTWPLGLTHLHAALTNVICHTCFPPAGIYHNVFSERGLLAKTKPNELRATLGLKLREAAWF